MNPNFKNYLLKTTKSNDCNKLEVIQSLWSGYGEIARYQLLNSEHSTVVVKCISPEEGSSHPRGWDSDLSHQRKLNSYKVETNWYESWSNKTTADCRIPKFLGSFSEGVKQWIVLEDLDVHFPLRKGRATFSDLCVCLKWLANFHATFLNSNGEDLWPIGTYWHLQTRPDEFQKIENKELKAKAHLIDKALNECEFKTIVHGDAKLANFCFSENTEQVAAVDFQYVGGGCGMKDVVYLLGSGFTAEECELHEEELLSFYFRELKKVCSSSIDFESLEQEWRNMYSVSWTDFTRFLMGWMPTHQKLNAYSLRLMEKVLKQM